jgi:hypothetical protein
MTGTVNITLLEGGILFHSVFVGITVSITIKGYIVLLIAILFHQVFEGLGLGSRIAAVPYPKGSSKWLPDFSWTDHRNQPFPYSAEILISEAPYAPETSPQA